MHSQRGSCQISCPKHRHCCRMLPPATLAHPSRPEVPRRGPGARMLGMHPSFLEFAESARRVPCTGPWWRTRFAFGACAWCRVSVLSVVRIFTLPELSLIRHHRNVKNTHGHTPCVSAPGRACRVAPPPCPRVCSRKNANEHRNFDDCACNALAAAEMKARELRS